MKTLKTILGVLLVGLCAACTDNNIKPQDNPAPITDTVQQVGFENAPVQTVMPKPQTTPKP